MDQQAFSFFRKNTIYLFVIAALLLAVSVLATVLVLVPADMVIQEFPILVTVGIWIALLLGTILGESKKVALFNMIIAIVGFICSFILAVSLFVQGPDDALSIFLFWISQILNAVFVLACYFGIHAYLEARGPVSKSSPSLKKRSTKKPKTKTKVKAKTDLV